MSCHAVDIFSFCSCFQSKVRQTKRHQASEFVLGLSLYHHFMTKKRKYEKEKENRNKYICLLFSMKVKLIAATHTQTVLEAHRRVFHLGERHQWRTTVAMRIKVRRFTAPMLNRGTTLSRTSMIRPWPRETKVDELNSMNWEWHFGPSSCLLYGWTLLSKDHRTCIHPVRSIEKESCHRLSFSIELLIAENKAKWHRNFPRQIVSPCLIQSFLFLFFLRLQIL